jgi:hypothetical protein
MKLTRSILSLTFAGAAIAAPAPAPAPAVLSANAAQQPPSLYPIGTGGVNAKVSGRLFDIDGRVEYFAGMKCTLSVLETPLIMNRFQCLVACPFE